MIKEFQLRKKIIVKSWICTSIASMEIIFIVEVTLNLLVALYSTANS